MRLSNESRILAGLCLADLISTLILMKSCGAEEANHVLRFYLDFGVPAFIGAKCFLFVPALLIAEHYRSHSPLLVTRLLRVVIGLYVGLYSTGVYAINHTPSGFKERRGLRPAPADPTPPSPDVGARAEPPAAGASPPAPAAAAPTAGPCAGPPPPALHQRCAA